MSPGVGMFKVVRLPPARKMAMSRHHGECGGVESAEEPLPHQSCRCCIRRPEGPAAVNLGKVRWESNDWASTTGVLTDVYSSFQVSSLLGAMG